MHYLIILKNEKTKNYRLISQLLVLFNLLGFVVLAIYDEHKIDKLPFIFLMVIISVYSFFTVLEWISKKVMPDFWHRSVLAFCALPWYKAGLWWITILLFLFILMDYLVHRKMTVKISDKKIILSSLPEKKIAWTSLNNVILKNRLLTIDFKNNKLFQHLILNSDEDIDERIFNDFCQSKLIASYADQFD